MDNIEYRKHPFVSQSILKALLTDNPRAMYRKLDLDENDREPEYFTKGNLTDVMTYLNDNNVKQYYHVLPTDFKFPSDAVHRIAHRAYKELINGEHYQNDTESFITRIVKIKEEESYESRWKLETNIKFANELLPYINFLKEAGDKILIPQDYWELCKLMAKSLTEGPYTKPIHDGWENHYQIDLYCDRLGIKGLLDLLQINHELKKIRVVDYKTTDKYLEEYNKYIYQRRLYIQLSFYSYLAKINFPNYIIEEPLFLVVSKQEPEYAEPFKINFDLLEASEFGNPDYRITGWRTLLQRYNYYKPNNYMYNEKVIENGYNELGL